MGRPTKRSKSELECPTTAQRSNVVLEHIHWRVKILGHLNLALEDVPRQFPAPLRNSGKPGHRLATVCDEDLFARSRPLDQPREAALGIMHIHYRGHENILARNSD